MPYDIKGYDQWKLSSGEENVKVSCKCDHCTEDIYVGEDCIDIDGDRVHLECFEAYSYDRLNAETITA